MAIRNFARYSVRPGGPPGTDTSAPCYVDKDDNKLKMVPGGAGSTTEVEIVDASTSQTLTNKTLTSPVITGATITGGTIGATLTPGAGVSSAETNKSAITREGGLIVTRLVVDLTGLHGSTTDLDIIGNVGAASAHFGQLTTAVNGTFCGGRVTCLEVPAGGTADINFYSAVESTGTEDAGGASSLTETVLVDAAGAWTSGATKGMTAMPAANDYLYIVNGAAGTVGTFSAGKFEIVLFGV
jgi:hypothetical protein